MLMQASITSVICDGGHIRVRGSALPRLAVICRELTPVGIAAVVAVAGVELVEGHGHGRVHAKVLIQSIQVGLADVARHV